ncbi:DUF323 domain-containing protein [Rickenella mellea]|uniref:DUF323 domain-containing protein n=1 Tax=Rickenella mellea TaxID=50990 RepID=A0A4Y7Q3H5_9AGAM|nr:DUF323 domain-containing protein [Rickenella mellea]
MPLTLDTNPNPYPHILDVRIPEDVQHSNGDGDIRDQIISGLTKPEGEKTLPTMLLYDERGLRLYDKITTDCTEYYLFGAEEQILRDNADAIVETMHARHAGAYSDGEVILELGAGALRKTSHILLALSRLVPSDHPATDPAPITYFALDLERRELDRTLKLVKSGYGSQLKGKVDTKGMWGTYDGGLKFVDEGGLDDGRSESSDNGSRERKRDVSPDSSDTGSTPSLNYASTPPSSTGRNSPDQLQSERPLHILFLGSSLGNFDREGGVAFLRSLPLRAGSGDTLLLGLDHANSKEKIEIAYNDPKGITREFIMNGLKGAGRAIGDEHLFEKGQWEYTSHYNVAERRHEAFYKSTASQNFTVDAKTNFSFVPGECVKIEESHKYSDEDAYTMFAAGELRPIMRWTDSAKQYSLWLLERPAFVFPPRVAAGTESDTLFGVPTLSDFEIMWKAWDTITLGMIPRTMLFTKPIDLRHICLFYLGHIPTFLDIHLSRLLEEPHTEPDEYKFIFERGIDPHVDDPTKCHPHSEVPQREEDWPTLEQILDFRDRVRVRLAKLYNEIASGQRQMTRKIGRVLFMTLEHEGWHIETLLYMLLQRAGIPGGTLPPPGFAPPNWAFLKETMTAPAPLSPTITLGPATIVFGHDDFEADDKDPKKATVVSGHEFGWDNEHPRRAVHVEEFKIEWRPVSNGQFYEFWKGDGKGKVKLPASWVEIDGEPQVRTLYGPISMDLAQDWPVLTSYDDLSTYAEVKGGRLPTEPELRLFFDMFKSSFVGGANVGFKNWHPVPYVFIII